jgi:hypothetical protein
LAVDFFGIEMKTGLLGWKMEEGGMGRTREDRKVYIYIYIYIYIS